MSMLSLQADSLRKYAERLRQLANGAVNQGFPARQDLFESAAEMREAADTIENLRDSLNEVADKWASEKIKAEDYARENMMLKANNGSRWFELFGTPKKAARALMEVFAMCNKPTIYCAKCPLSKAPACYGNDDGDYDAFLEWLRGDA